MFKNRPGPKCITRPQLFYYAAAQGKAVQEPMSVAVFAPLLGNSWGASLFYYAGAYFYYASVTRGLHRNYREPRGLLRGVLKVSGPESLAIVIVPPHPQHLQGSFREGLQGSFRDASVKLLSPCYCIIIGSNSMAPQSFQGLHSQGLFVFA